MSAPEAVAAAKEAGTIPTPPFDPDAEQALLAAVLSDPRRFPEAAEIVTVDMLGDARHAEIWGIAAALDGKGQKPTPQAVAGGFSDVEARRYVLALAGVGIPFNVESYAKAVRDVWTRREIHRAAIDAAHAAAYPTSPQAGSEIVETLDARLFEIGEHQAADAKPVTLAQAGEQMLRLYATAAANGGAVGRPTGYDKIDAMIGGLEGGNLYILGARPSMGKTALAVGIIGRQARAGARVAFFQLEMTAAQIARRMAATHAGIDVSEIKRARLDSRPFALLVDAQRELAELPIEIIDRPNIHASQIRAIARRMKRRGGLDLVVVDHLTLMGAPQEWTRQGPVYAVGQNSGALKRLAKELDVPVLCLCQLSRSNEAREEKRPQLSDLRWSGEIEQDADVVMFVHREEYYLTRAEPTHRPNESADDYQTRRSKWEAALDAAKGKAEIIFAKQRDGDVGIVKLGFEGPTTRFHDLDEPGRFESPQTTLALEGPA